VVYIDCYFTDHERIYHNIGLQDWQGGYEIARHLLSQGHTEIVFLANNQLYTGGDPVRFNGCQKAFLEQGKTLCTDSYRPLPNDRNEREELYRYLASDKTQCTAMVFSADYYAAEAVSFLKDCAIEVPSQVSVTGFDDNVFARLVQPRLTTVHQDAGEKGRLAVAMLMKLIRKEPVGEVNVQLPIHLVIRDSVQRLR
jgi:LacI family transcriptional regulator